jgi:hypothetical protein
MHPATFRGLWLLCAAGGQTLQSQDVRLVPLPASYVENGYEFNGSIGAVVEFSDSSVLISDTYSRELRLLNWRANSARLIGSWGRGPGEYLSVGALFRTDGDSALLFQSSLGKVLVATPKGTKESGPFQLPGGALLRGADRTGRLLMLAGFGSMGPGKPLANMDPISADSMLVLLKRVAALGTDTLARVRGLKARQVSVNWWLNERQTVRGRIANPLAGGDDVAMYADGWIAIAYREPYRVDWFTPAAEWVRGPKLERNHVRVDLKVKEASLAELKKVVHDVSAGTFTDWPEWLPPFVVQALIQSYDGRLIVERTPATKPGMRLYDVINRRGRLESQLEMPRNARLRYAGRFGLYVVFTDDDDVQHVRRYVNPLR